MRNLLSIIDESINGHSFEKMEHMTLTAPIHKLLALSRAISDYYAKKKESK